MGRVKKFPVKKEKVATPDSNPAEDSVMDVTQEQTTESLKTKVNIIYTKLLYIFIIYFFGY